MHTIPQRFVWVVFWACCAWYIATASGHTYSPDEETMYAVTRAIVHTGQVNIVSDGSEALAALRPSEIGAVAPYGILPSLLAIPFYVSGLLLAPTTATQWDMTHLLVSLYNAPISAACVALLLRILIRLPIPRTGIIILTVTYAVGSLTWPYARTFFSEPLTTMLVLWSVNAAIDAHTSPQPAPHIVFLSGIMAGLLLPTRIAASVMIPLVGLFVVVGCRRQPIRTAIYWLVGCLPGLLLFVAYNYVRYHTFFATGYSSEITAFVTPLQVGLAGLLIDPFTGLLWFVPMLVFAPIGAWYLWRQQHRLVLLCVALIASQVFLYAGWNAWDGGGVWGPRFLVPIVPFGIILCAGWWLRSPPMASRVMIPIVGASIVINILGCAVNFNIDSNLPHPRTPPIVAHARIAWQRWHMAGIPAQSCVLQHGWYASEAADGYLFQRSGATALITCHTVPQSRITLLLDDRRPANAPASALSVRFNAGAPFPVPTGRMRTVHVLTTTTTTHIQIHNTPWNPVAIAYSDRNDDLGPTILALTAYPALTTVYNAAVAPIPSIPKARWAWFYDPSNHHLIDWWGWYLPMTSLAPWYAWICVAFGVLVCMLCGLAYGVARRAPSHAQR